MSKSKCFLGLSCIFFAANFLWLIFFDNKAKNPDFVFEQFYTFQAQVLAADKKLDGWNLLVRPDNLADFSGKLIAYLPLYPEYHYGDILQISCLISQPEPITAEDSQTFFYDKYLAKDGIYGICFRPQIKLLSQHKNFYFYLYSAKNYFWQNLNNYLREPASSLAKAMLLAQRREIPDELREVFARVGLSHMMAISGLHMAVIIWLMQFAFLALGLSRQQAFGCLLVILLLYLFLIGFPSSAVRASLMVIVALSGAYLGRNTNSVYSLILAADIFVLLNPYVLLYDIGFQLSFLAVLGLIYYVDFFQKIFSFVPKRLKLREVLAVTLAAQVFTWPLIVYYFQIFSLIAPVANFFILPFLPAVLVLALLLALSGFWSGLAGLIAWPLYLILELIVLLARILAQIPCAFLVIKDFSFVFLISSLIFMFLITFVIKPQEYE